MFVRYAGSEVHTIGLLCNREAMRVLELLGESLAGDGVPGKDPDRG
jgi:hypothetical protein